MLSIGSRPDFGRKYSQIDIVRVKRHSGLFGEWYPEITVGTILSRDNIQDFFDAKTGDPPVLSDPDRVDRHSTILRRAGYSSRRLRVLPSPVAILDRDVDNIVPNPSWTGRAKIVAGILGTAGITAKIYALTQTEEQEEALMAVVTEANRIRELERRPSTDPGLLKSEKVNWVMGPVRDYLAFYIVDDRVLDFTTAMLVYKTIAENPIGDAEETS